MMTNDDRPPVPPLRDGATYDVIVVGARAAGSATAMLLARHGLRTLVLEQGSPGADTLSTHALMRGAVIQLSRWGLLDEIVAAGTPPVRRTTFRYGSDRIAIDIKPSHGIDAFYAPRRTLLDSTLVRAASAAGAEVHHHTTVIDLVRRSGRVAGVVAASIGGGFAELRAPLVIGADGIRSTIARHVDAPYTRRGVHSGAVTYGYWTGLQTEGYEWVFRANACSGAIPTNDGRTCVFASAPRDRIGRGGPGLIAEIVAEGSPELAERLAAATPPVGTRTWPGQPGYLRQASGPGWALVGDAGYFKDPISAHGLTDALRDAELMARAVIDGGDAPVQLDESLAEFERTRDRLSLPLFDVTDQIAAHDWDDARIADLLVQLSKSTNAEIDEIASLMTGAAR